MDNNEVAATSTKPPPTVVSVAGFDAFECLKRGEGEIDLNALCKLPPFQMFMAEREPTPVGIPADRYALERARAACGQVGQAALLAAYENWHAAQGLWLNETPYGAAI